MGTVEFAELILLASDLLHPGLEQVEFASLGNAQHALLEFAAPPWGFTGESSTLAGPEWCPKVICGGRKELRWAEGGFCDLQL